MIGLLLSVLLLLTFLLYATKKLFKSYVILMIFIFIKLIFLVMGIPVTYINIIIEGLGLGLVFILWHHSRMNRRRFDVPGMGYFWIFTIAVIVSYFINNHYNNYSEVEKTLSFYRHLLVSYLFFLFAYNYPFSKSQLKTFILTFNALLILQIFGGILKLFFIGLAEKYVGLMEERAGSLNAIFPLIAISYLSIMNFYYRKIKYFWWIVLGMLFIGIIGIKRGFVVFLPILFLLLYYFYGKYYLKQSYIFLKGILISPILVVVLFIIIFFGVILNPMLNKEGKIGGSFNLDYAYNTAVDHNMGNSRSKYSEGRVSSLIKAIDIRFSDISLENMFGDGPGKFVDVDNESSEIQEYGILTFTVLSSLIQQLLSIGIIGTLTVILFYSYFLFLSLKELNTRKDKFGISIGVFVLITGIIFFYDHIIYSPVFFSTHVPNFIFFTFSGILLNKQIKSDIMSL